MSTTNTPTATTKKEARVAENRKRVSTGVLVLSIFAGWMWHAAETAKPGITQEETTKIAESAGGGLSGAVNGGRTAAQGMGLGDLLQPTSTVPAGQLGGVSNGGS